MEIFLDGGLFELIVALAFGYTINYIFSKKYLLIILSIIAVVSPIALLFFKTGELYSWLVSICIINSILLVVLLWKYREKFPSQAIINVDRLKRNFPFKKLKSKSLFTQKVDA